MRAGVLGCLTLAAAVAAAAPASAATRVVSTTADLAALAAAVGENLVEVQTIVPPGSDPEAFEPRPGDLDKVRHADILVRVGLGYDYWLDRLIGQIADRRLMRGGEAYVDASAGIPLLEIRGQSVVNEGGHAHGVANPHYWLDPENAAIVTAGIAEALARRIPAEAARILANRERILGKLIAEGRRANVRAILHEPYEPDDASRLVAQKLGVPFVLLATSVGSVAGVKDYLDLFEYNTATLAKALGAPGE